MPESLASICAEPLTGGRGIFSRVLVGVDGSDESCEAARQAALLGDVEGELTLLAVWDETPPLFLADAMTAAEASRQVAREAAEAALSEALRAVSPYASPRGKLIRGLAIQCLIEEIDRDRDTLVVVASHDASSELIQRCPCSVLVARTASPDFPQAISVGVDGSPESAAAYAAARYLQKRFHADLRAIVAGGGEIDERLVSMILGEHHELADGDPVEVLVGAGGEADLLLVGARGLHGLKAVGSVSERVAREAACSTLLVREPPWQRVREELQL